MGKHVEAGIGLVVLLFVLSIIIGVIATVEANPAIDDTTKLVVPFIGTMFGLGVMWGGVKGFFGQGRRR